MNTRYNAIVSLCLAAVFSLCTAGPAWAQSSMACKMLSRGVIGAAIGGKVGAGQPIGSKGCQWLGGSLRATLTISDAHGWAMMKTPLPGTTQAAAPGIGDDAFYTTIATLTTLSAKKGNSVIVVRLYGVKGKAKQMSAEKTLARHVLKRL